MIRIIGFIKAKDGMSPAEFKAYYEDRHAPLMRRLLPTITDYRRNYLDFEDSDTARYGAAMDFNVVTEASFESEEAYRLFLKAFEQHGAEILADEQKFVKHKRRLLVHQCVTPPPALPSEATALRTAK